VNEYARRLEAQKRKKLHTLKEVKDQWRTPDPLFFGIEHMLEELHKGCGQRGKARFVMDLFTDGQNAKTPFYYTAENNALKQDWSGDLALIGGPGDYTFANPPYSINQRDDGGDILTGMKPIMAKAEEEREKGWRGVFLIKGAVSETWWPENVADRVLFIKGRIPFQLPVWFRNPEVKKAGAMFGAAVLIYNKELRENKVPLYLPLKTIMSMGQEKSKALAEERKSFIESFEL
jgi:phage N-6-adenine-methyltransferase